MSMSNKRIDSDPLTDEEVGDIRVAYNRLNLNMSQLVKKFKRNQKIISAIVGTPMTAHEIMMRLSGKYAEANKSKQLIQTELLINLPPLRPDLRDFEKQAGISVDVLVSVGGSSCVTIGRYLHGVKEWQANGFGGNGFTKVTEWWPLPEAGTGTKV